MHGLHDARRPSDVLYVKRTSRLALQAHRVLHSTGEKRNALFSYLRQQDPTLPTTIDLAREAERREIERSSRVVVSQAVSLPVTNMVRQDTQGQGQDADPSAGQHIDLDPDPDLDRDERLAWSTSKVRTRAGEREPRCEPWARNATPNLVPNNQANGVPHETNNTRQQPPATPAQKGCRAAWLLLDQLQAEIARFRCETHRTRSGRTSILVWTGFLASGGHAKRLRPWFVAVGWDCGGSMNIFCRRLHQLCTTVDVSPPRSPSILLPVSASVPGTRELPIEVLAMPDGVLPYSAYPFMLHETFVLLYHRGHTFPDQKWHS
ncbi:hypothetical protein EDB83DRAFT_2451362 [Lactarius deliciosus]|nr:hypothetical protein EDB83DRAFT_2451362 [Lactarius deliciosus]